MLDPLFLALRKFSLPSIDTDALHSGRTSENS
uniref:Uncharacterized protein n=1 Tax=Anguilla anguilla TaxID=7936 RepID=A0A0E9PLJ1_ANGAN